MKRYVCIAALVGASILPAAYGLTPNEVRECQALHESFPDRQKNVQTAVATRDELAEVAERAGETWENAENVRTLGPEAAADADGALERFDTAKAAFYSAEAEAHALVQALNDSLALFNTKCVAG